MGDKGRVCGHRFRPVHNYGEVRSGSLTVYFSSVISCSEGPGVRWDENLIDWVIMMGQERLKGLEDVQRSDYKYGPQN